MLIGSKLPPLRTERTYFSSGRAAFAYLLRHVVRPRRVYLPSFTCWSLVSTMIQRFPDIELTFYPVDRDLCCLYPEVVADDEMLVFIHFFGHENRAELPPCEGTLLEDWSHSYMSQIAPRGDYVFGSYRKVLKVADGGFINTFFNPVYEPSHKLDNWLRLEAMDWRDVREAENMIDRQWTMSDISSQSLAVLLAADEAVIRLQRQANERYLTENLSVGRPLLSFWEGECPLIHNRIMASQEERDALRSFLAGKGVFTSIHWPTHEAVKSSGVGADDALWIEEHNISIPVSNDYNLNDMEYICRAVEEWAGQQ